MEDKILELFLYNNRMKFSEIENALGVRSNKLAYHIKKLVGKKVLEREGETYTLSESAEYLIPYLSAKKAVLPVVLIHIGNKEKCFLHIRNKRPYKDYLSLPGGRLMIGEEIGECVKRIMKEKHKINAKLDKINSISLEQVYSKTKIVHSFLLLFVSATSKDKLELIEIENSKKKIIKSDYYLINNKIGEKVKIETINSRL